MISTDSPVASDVFPPWHAFVSVCAAAGALAVPVDAIVTPLAAAAAALLGMAGLRAWQWSRLPRPARGRSVVWIAGGLVVGLLLLAVIRWVIAPMLPEMGARIARAGALPLWRRVVIIYVAAVTEELIFRLLLFSVIAGLLARLLRRPGKVPQAVDVWSANLVSALAFGVVHLPAWSGVAHLSVGLLASVVALNAAAGLFLGHVFAMRGISAAMWAHAGGDCAVQLIGPLIA